MREKGQTEVAKTLETPVFSRGIEILTEKVLFSFIIRQELMTHNKFLLLTLRLLHPRLLAQARVSVLS